jgi:hypothetical protein
MNLEYAVERLYSVGWTPEQIPVNEPAPVDLGLMDRLPDGRTFPTVSAVKCEFARAGLELQIKQNLVFNCYRATWGPIGEPLDPAQDADDLHGTVIGDCEREAAVYALAQLRAAQGRQPLLTA